MSEIEAACLVNDDEGENRCASFFGALTHYSGCVESRSPPTSIKFSYATHSHTPRDLCMSPPCVMWLPTVMYTTHACLPKCYRWHCWKLVSSQVVRVKPELTSLSVFEDPDIEITVEKLMPSNKCLPRAPMFVILFSLFVTKFPSTTTRVFLGSFKLLSLLLWSSDETIVNKINMLSMNSHSMY